MGRPLKGRYIPGCSGAISRPLILEFFLISDKWKPVLKLVFKAKYSKNPKHSGSNQFHIFENWFWNWLIPQSTRKCNRREMTTEHPGTFRPLRGRPIYDIFKLFFGLLVFLGRVLLGAHDGALSPHELLLELWVDEILSEGVTLSGARIHLGKLANPSKFMPVGWPADLVLTGVLHEVGPQVGLALDLGRHGRPLLEVLASTRGRRGEAEGEAQQEEKTLSILHFFLSLFCVYWEKQFGKLFYRFVGKVFFLPFFENRGELSWETMFPFLFHFLCRHKESDENFQEWQRKKKFFFFKTVGRKELVEKMCFPYSFFCKDEKRYSIFSLFLLLTQKQSNMDELRKGHQRVSFLVQNFFRQKTTDILEKYLDKELQFSLTFLKV